MLQSNPSLPLPLLLPFLVKTLISANMDTKIPTEVHRVPPSINKRCGSARKEAPDAKRHKARVNRRDSKGDKPGSADPKQRPRIPGSPMDCEPQFEILKTDDPVQAKRIVQRRKMISKGKNTAGYDAYVQQVPKEKRRVRSMDTPMTPNPSLDIPGKRWQGLVRAWYVLHWFSLGVDARKSVFFTHTIYSKQPHLLYRRVALHKYDPPDMVDSVAEVSDSKETKTPAKENEKPETLQARQLEEAAAKGLLVDLGEEEALALDAISPMSVLTEQTSRTPVRREIDFEENDTGGLGLDNDNDSDDDLL